MKLVATFHNPSSVTASLKCRLTEQPDESLVVAKADSVDVFSLKPEGLQHECSLGIWGRIILMRAVPIQGSRRSNVLIMTDHPDPELVFLTYQKPATGAPSLSQTSRLSLYEKSPRPAEYFLSVLVDASGKFAVVSCYAGKLKFVFLQNGDYESDVDLSIAEMNLLSMCFLDAVTDTKVLAMLFLDNKERIQLHARDIDYDLKHHQAELSQTPSSFLLPSFIPSKCFSFPDNPPSLAAVSPSIQSGLGGDFPGGVLILGGRKILLYEFADQFSQDKYNLQVHRRRQSLGRNNADDVLKQEREMVRKPTASVVWPWSDVRAWCEAGSASGKYLIGDAYGRLAMVSLTEMKTNGIILIPLGETSPASCLTYLTNQVLYLGSRFGNSQLLRAESTPVSQQENPALQIPSDIKTTTENEFLLSSKGKAKEHVDSNMHGTIVSVPGTRLTVLEAYQNIAPIMDAVLVDPDGGGQPNIVTCSGVGNTGSLNIVRKGADFEELAAIHNPLTVTGIWALRPQIGKKFDTHILVSTLHESLLFRLEDDVAIKHEDSGSSGFVTSRPTLAVANCCQRSTKNRDQTISMHSNANVVQVTPTGVTVLEFDMISGSFLKIGQQWTSESMVASNPSWRNREIVAASLNPSQIFLGMKGSRAALFELNGRDQVQLVACRDFASHEISAVSCVPCRPSESRATRVLVAFWVSHCVQILTITDESLLIPVCKTSPLGALPRSVLLHSFGDSQHTEESDQRLHLLAGLTDGTLASFAMKDNELTDSMTISLGDIPVSLLPCNFESRRVVFASGRRAAVLFWSKERLHHSPVLLKDVTAVSSLNIKAFPSCLILANPTGLRIGKVRDVNKMHIRTIPFGFDNPRKISYHPVLRVLAVACVKPEPARICDDEFSKSSLRLLDDTTFSQLAQFDFDTDERVTAVESLTLTYKDTSQASFCVGTHKLEHGEQEITEGKLRVFDACNAKVSGSTRLQLTPKVSANVRGCVYALASINGMIAAAVNASVIIFTFKQEDLYSITECELVPLAEWNHNYIVLSLVVHDNKLIIGDAISSVSVLTLEGNVLHTLARDYGALWPISLGMFDDNTVIGANADFNLFSFGLQPSGTLTILERNGSYHIDDHINKFLPGQLTSPGLSAEGQLQPKQLFFSSFGRIGVIIDIEAKLALQLTALQRNMAAVISGVGSANHTRFRAPRTARGISDAEMVSFGFLDGDFLEQLLNHPPETWQRIQEGQSEAERLATPLDQIRQILELLQSMH